MRGLKFCVLYGLVHIFLVILSFLKKILLILWAKPYKKGNKCYIWFGPPSPYYCNGKFNVIFSEIRPRLGHFKKSVFQPSWIVKHVLKKFPCKFKCRGFEYRQILCFLGVKRNNTPANFKIYRGLFLNCVLVLHTIFDLNMCVYGTQSFLH